MWSSTHIPAYVYNAHMHSILVCADTSQNQKEDEKRAGEKNNNPLRSMVFSATSIFNNSEKISCTQIHKVIFSQSFIRQQMLFGIHFAHAFNEHTISDQPVPMVFALLQNLKRCKHKNCKICPELSEKCIGSGTDIEIHKNE